MAHDIDAFPPETTSLSALSEHDWQILRNTWCRGIDWNVQKIGRKWSLHFGGFPLFKTKTAAYEAGSRLIRWESLARYRREHQVAA